MPRKKPIRVDDLKAQTKRDRDPPMLKCLGTRQTRRASPLTLCGYSGDWRSYTDKKCELNVKAHEGLIRASRLFVALSQMNSASTQAGSDCHGHGNSHQLYRNRAVCVSYISQGSETA